MQRSFIVQAGKDPPMERVPLDRHGEGMKKNLPTVENYISFAVGKETYDGFIPYEEALAKASPEEPAVEVEPTIPGSSCTREAQRVNRRVL